MHAPDLLSSVLFFLLATVIFVPLFRRLHLGAILGYLIAGVVIGPQLLHWIDDPERILHASEIGVVLLLFVIGLELNPEKLWAMRHQIGLLGGGQLVLSMLLIAVPLYYLHAQWQLAVVIGLAMALSSTAFAVQLMAERGLLASANGRRGFAILLMQDLAVIPILLIVQLLAGGAAVASAPWWQGVLAVILLLLCGRYLLNPLLNMVSQFGSRETMTATALLIVVGAAYLMNSAGLSMGLGAFIAGIMLANSHFRQQLEADIEPFKGLTLGLFFIAIGMSLNIELLLAKPLLIIGLALALMTLKTLVIVGLLLLSRVDWRSALPLGLMLSQGGEFAFVIMGEASTLAMFSPAAVEISNLVVGFSMALTAPLVALAGLIPASKGVEDSAQRSLPQIDHQPEVLILGFGRFAQITGRILAANHIPFTALDNNASHINFIKQFGNKIHFGDIMRLDVLQAGGINTAHTVLIAIEDIDKSEALAKTIRAYYPEIMIIARAYDRSAYLRLLKAGVNKVIREVFLSSLEAATATLEALGYTTTEAIQKTTIFQQHDEKILEQQLEHADDLEKTIELSRQGRRELEQLFKQDKADIA
ncbi:MAG: monovalent cation:proton antiporter-2 (CPA2) family protein [Cellvibrionaceae bacterium]|nr:monovalent cation:proton antiporter-2 (CPA2) family protein [Cellvibrionaceae bacterium]